MQIHAIRCSFFVNFPVGQTEPPKRLRALAAEYPNFVTVKRILRDNGLGVEIWEVRAKLHVGNLTEFYHKLRFDI